MAQLQERGIYAASSAKAFRALKRLKPALRRKLDTA
jgi:hypothetical protein